MIVRLLFICCRHRNFVVKLYARRGNLGEFFSLLLLICPVLVRGCGTLGKALVLRVGMCGLWLVCCQGRPHFPVRYDQIPSNSRIGIENWIRGCENSKCGSENTTRGCLLSPRVHENSPHGREFWSCGSKNTTRRCENSTRGSSNSKAGQEIEPS